MMITVKHKIISGFPCNNNSIYAIITEDYGTLTTTSKEQYEEAMSNGYVELEHEEYPTSESVLSEGY